MFFYQSASGWSRALASMRNRHRNGRIGAFQGMNRAEMLGPVLGEWGR